MTHKILNEKSRFFSLLGRAISPPAQSKKEKSAGRRSSDYSDKKTHSHTAEDTSEKRENKSHE